MTAAAVSSDCPTFEGHTSNVDRLLNAEDVAQRWQVRPNHVYRLAREGKVPFVAIGRYRRFRLSAIEAFEQAGGAGADD